MRSNRLPYAILAGSFIYLYYIQIVCTWAMYPLRANGRQRIYIYLMGLETMEPTTIRQPYLSCMYRYIIIYKIYIYILLYNVPIPIIMSYTTTCMIRVCRYKFGVCVCSHAAYGRPKLDRDWLTRGLLSYDPTNNYNTTNVNYKHKYSTLSCPAQSSDASDARPPRI